MLLDSVQVRTTSKPRPGKPLKILTVGGWAPHKCQHLIPEICRQLKQKGINFHWDLIGPTSRVVGYDEAIREQISQLGLSSEISVHGAVPLADLAKYYSEANLYVQPSTEEGFC
ncbi:glycosyltransferase, partial [Rhodopirellula bahusiensis]